MNARLDLYTPVHRGLRHLLLDTQQWLSRLDPLDTTSVGAWQRRLAEFVRMLRVHLDDEQRFLQAAIARAQPDVARTIDADHTHHEQQLLEVEHRARHFGQTPTVATKRALERTFDAFVSDTLAHMRVEEEEVMPALHRAFTDQELGGFLQSILMSIAPDDMVLFRRWMLSGLPESDRLDWLRGMKATAPVHVVQETLAQAHAVLPALEAKRLEASLLAA